MQISVFDLFKIGIGPSSSHTVGPMVAAGRFLNSIKELNLLSKVSRVRVSVHGSLAFTGKGHNTDIAVILGLSGEKPDTIDPSCVPKIVEGVRAKKRLNLNNEHLIVFSEDTDLIFDFEHILPGHSNGMLFEAINAANEKLCDQIYYSTGGGFVATPHEMLVGGEHAEGTFQKLPYYFRNADEMLVLGNNANKTISEMVYANELSRRPKTDIDDRLNYIWLTMKACIKNGMKNKGMLPGKLKVRRRAAEIYSELINQERKNLKMPHDCMDWLSLYAIAVNEENAAGGTIVTAPTNGAAGVIPAVIQYYENFCPGADETGIRDFLLSASAIGGLIKLNASISGAEAGCQGEIGSASAMAAAGLAAVLGGTNEQIENAAEIALEHHLGMTCDPVGGLVQIPCIERNAMGSVKAVNAASLAIKGDGKHYVSLDTAVETMRQTGLDMQSKYKETSLGGLAVNVVAC
ncbi:MAG: L-serine dehydratase 1 [Alphaproteobacteria bacterium MarineAlpha3_Bin5]|nr:L-serine ammonia-lyase [Magnetovibrio sp.]PPR78034.1 MAG: L-serine dehydratase 1 [Alphaproteobacteria bacterium MarineAlpha3_Bin5]